MVSEQIKKLRIAKNITQYRLAKDSGVTPATVYNLENGKAVNVSTLEKVSDTLGCEILIQPKDNSNNGE